MSPSSEPLPIGLGLLWCLSISKVVGMVALSLYLFTKLFDNATVRSARQIPGDISIAAINERTCSRLIEFIGSPLRAYGRVTLLRDLRFFVRRLAGEADVHDLVKHVEPKRRAHGDREQRQDPSQRRKPVQICSPSCMPADKLAEQIALVGRQLIALVARNGRVRRIILVFIF